MSKQEIIESEDLIIPPTDSLSLARFLKLSADATVQLRQTGEQVRLMAAQMGLEFCGLAICSGIAITVLWQVSDHRLLMAWFVALLASGVARAALQRRYRRTLNDIQDSSHPRWARRFCVCAMFTGILWSSLLLIVPTSAVAELGVLFAISTGYLALASGVLGVYVPAYHALAVPVLFAFLSVAALRSDAQLLPQALVLAVIGVGSAWHAHRQARFQARQIRRRFELSELNERLAAERDHAELALLAKNQFLSAASHDLRQPVIAIGLYAGVLQSRLEHQDVDGLIGKMQESIAGLSTLFDGILDLSRLDANGHHNAPRPTEIDPLLERLAREFDLQARMRGLTLSVDICTGMKAQVDPILLERVLSNLIGNAIKYTDQGSIAVTVEHHDDRLNLRVHDTGRGIAENECERIFTEYHQIRNASGKLSSGQGLGLAIVKRLCEVMDVPIELTSAPGQGTTFSLSIASCVASSGRKSIESSLSSQAQIFECPPESSMSS